MDHRPQAWGRPRDDVYGAYDHSYFQENVPQTHTQRPMITGTSVVAVKFKDGVVIAADNLGSYGSLARFTDIKRLKTFQDTSVIGFSGDVSDMQFLDRFLLTRSIEEAYLSPPASDDAADAAAAAPTRLNAANLHRWLSKHLYSRRNKFDPLWCHLLVAGFDDDEQPFLASADLLGTTFSAPSLATGYGAMLAQPILRRRVPDEDAVKTLDKHDAVELVKECLKVLFYRDARSLDSYSLAVITKDNIDMSYDNKLENQSWAFAERIRGYGTQTV